MTRIVRAELHRVLRRRTLVVTVLGCLAFAVVSALTVFANAEPSADGATVVSRRGAPPLAALTGHGGGTEAFVIGASFVGFFVFVTFIAVLAGEFSGGTFRALLLRDPHRRRLIVGKLLGLLLVAAGAVALAEVLTLLVSLAVAPGNDIATSQWFTLTSAGDAIRDYATVFAGVTGWAVFGTTLAVVFRSTPIALGVGFAWAGPFENIVVDSWTTGYRVFPGQVLGSLIRGGTVELGLDRAVLTAAVYAVVAAAVSLWLVSTRDVTA
jgi:ABC-type transport system involved in multi-copper enzyme maturation permease subunit